MIENWDQYKDLEYYPDRVCACGCGGRIKVRPSHRYYGIPEYIHNHHMRVNHPNRVPLETRTCAAPGCNITFEVKVTSKRKYCCRGHSRKGKNNSKEQNVKIRANHRGGKVSKPKPKEIRICGCGCEGTFECMVDSKQKFLQGHGSKGRPPWNKNLTKETDPRVAQASKKLSNLMKANMQNPEYREKFLASMIKTRGKHSEVARQLWQDPEYISKQMIARGVSPNKPEKFLDELFQRFFSNQIKYTGDGKDKDFIIASKCPDFIFANGQKKIIELFGDYWHGEEVTGISNKQHEQERIDLFAQYGFQTLIIWEHELEDIYKLEKRVLEFHNV